ncbi:MAG: methionine adenosyltransferase, partial [Spirochaetota bacterium]
MARKEYLFTSESYAEGEPDKLADIISDSIVDAYLDKDKESKIDVSTFLTKNKIIVGGDIKSKADVNIDNIIKDTLKEIGYNDISLGMDYANCEIEDYIKRNSADSITDFDNNGVDKQNILFGYAINDSDAYMPLTLTLAHTLVKKLTSLRKEGRLSFLLPDAKCQITLQYDSKGKPKRLDSVLIMAQHKKEVNIKEIREAIIEELIKKNIPNSLIDKSSKFYINPTGDYNEAGPLISVGISGRKTAMDTYDSWCRFTDMSISGKDPLNVSRSGTYMLRKICKNLVAGGMAQKIEIQLAYIPGMPNPVTLFVES